MCSSGGFGRTDEGRPEKLVDKGLSKMSALQLVSTLLCLGAALWLASLAFRPAPGSSRGRKPTLDSSLRGKLPAVGKAGSVTRAQKRQLKKQAINGFKLGRLSSEQAQILIDCADYIDAVWNGEPTRTPSEISRQDREAALGLILGRADYLRRVLTWQQARKGTGGLPLPKDACRSAVAYLMTQRRPALN